MSEKFRVFYTDENPDAPPFCFSFSGTTFVIQPPNKFWKMIDTSVKVGTKLNKLNQPIKDEYRTIQVWVPDEAKNASGVKPRNWEWMTEDMWKFCQQAKFLDFHPYLERTQDIERSYEDEKAALRKQHQEEIERERKLLQFELEKERSKNAERLAKARGENKETENRVSAAAEVKRRKPQLEDSLEG